MCEVIRAAKRLISLIGLIAQLNLLIVVSTHILFVTFFSLFVFHFADRRRRPIAVER